MLFAALTLFGFIVLCNGDFGRDELEIKLNQLNDDIDAAMLAKFLDFAATFNRFSDYETNFDTILLQRFESFASADIYIEERNKVGLPYTLGHTAFSDKTDDEKLNVIMDGDWITSDSQLQDDSDAADNYEKGQCTWVSFTGDSDATSDWRDYDVGIANQHSCGSCWVFGDVGMIEVNRNLDTGIEQKLSEQMMLDCSPEDIGTCDGGYPIEGLSWVWDYGGIESDDEYGSYIGWEKNCSYEDGDALYGKWSDGDLYCLTDQTDEQLTLAVTAFDVGFGYYVYYDFYFYVDGIYTCTADSGSYLGGHWVSAIGVTEDYYIVKNSWGTDWGMDGYFLMNHSAVGSCDMQEFALVTYLDLDDSNALTEGADGSLYIDATKVNQLRSDGSSDSSLSPSDESETVTAKIGVDTSSLSSSSISARPVFGSISRRRAIGYYSAALIIGIVALYIIVVWIFPKTIVAKYYKNRSDNTANHLDSISVAGAGAYGSVETHPLLQSL